MLNEGFFLMTIGGYLMVLMVTRGYLLRHALTLAQQDMGLGRGIKILRDEGIGFLVYSFGTGVLVFGAWIVYFFDPLGILPLQWPVPLVVRWGGVMGAVGMFPLFVWVHYVLGTSWRVREDGGGQHILLRSGPYRLIRHPMFVVTSAILGCLAIATANLLVGLSVVFMVLLMVVWAPREERRLLEEFGDAYRQYMDETGRFFPKRFSSRDSST